MRVSIERKQINFSPDSSRVIARYFMNGESRTQNLVKRILKMNTIEVSQALEQTLRAFANRHRNISQLFFKHCENIREIIEKMDIPFNTLSEEQKMLIGSYCTMEYSIESAAFFNPSIVEDLDQSYLEKGEKRVIISFRATGEGHISSLVFRRGIIDANNDLFLTKLGDYIDMAAMSRKTSFYKSRFIKRLKEMQVEEQYFKIIMDKLPDRFEHSALKELVNSFLQKENVNSEAHRSFEEIKWLLESFYDLHFHKDSDITERVIFPISESESKGIEDARFVRFIEDDQSIVFYATYTAYNGHTILPKLIATKDFYTFRIMPLRGDGAKGKNLALFPKKIKGQYAMLSRIDGVNNYLMYSKNTNFWNKPERIQEPKFAWEFTQIGNCGSPLWTEKGWLIITHGVGPMRRYCIGASLFDLEDPSIEIGRLEEPLLIPLEEERNGYVPNVVYSCGSIIHNNSLILPYAVSDYSSTYAVVDMTELFTALIN
ncbi:MULTISPECIES: glycoside hydrolase family 130 protein [unclassified Zunongwangia]|uniref:glycoside hydrolase family 130 protein n=1 Tax=unclassified Zunongwangia TaxID=2632541 RepID=UPI0022DE6185|nr:glycoside hydrolase family 130 protein [Zunongwangia sp. HGR-M22]WBL24211.1 glycoside hydrolase family 130 protein [Zunongwangia sp. HGR-M22]